MYTEQLKSELQMLTGVYSNDCSYLITSLLKDKFKEEKVVASKFVKRDEPRVDTPEDLDDWFENL